ncbi:MAG: ABC transporter ATP-binding protein [Candidatus Sumerlaeota bacterium]
MSDRTLLRVRDLCKYFPVWKQGLMRRRVGEVRACDQLNFDLMEGETLGLVGESGCGKTTTARTILRAIEPTSGHVFFRRNGGEVDLAVLPERDIRTLRTEMQMIFQDPFSSLNPRMTVGKIVAEPLKIHKVASGKEMWKRVDEMLERVGLRSEHRQRYPHAFSGGQRQRIGIARALVLQPRLIVADEAVSALDVSVQAQVINLLQDLQDEFGLTYIFVAHDLAVVRHICDRIAVMYAGKIVELAPAAELFENPLHPYSHALLSAIPQTDPHVRLEPVMTGSVADPANLPPGCSFHPRCNQCFEPCDHVLPQLEEVSPNHWVACHLHTQADAPALVSSGIGEGEA